MQITIDGRLVRTHPARHDKTKEHGALAQPREPTHHSEAVSPPTWTIASATAVGRFTNSR